MVCRVSTTDWPLTLRVSREGPVASKACRSEDMGGVKLPGAEVENFETGGDDDVVGGKAAGSL